MQNMVYNANEVFVFIELISTFYLSINEHKNNGMKIKQKH